MELKRINYKSAIFFGALALFMYLVIGIFKGLLVTQVPEAVMYFGSAFGAWMDLVVSPIIGGVTTYLFAIFTILVYNNVAKKYPVSWTVKK